jgi:hypothetical protein
VSGAAESKDGDRAKRGERAPAPHGVVERRTEPALVERINASDLRAITPEEIQILAATGC